VPDLVVDLSGCSRTEARYVMCSRMTSENSLTASWVLENCLFTKQWPEELRDEFAYIRLMHLKRKISKLWERKVQELN